MVSLLALVAALPAGVGIAQAMAGAWLTHRFAAGEVRSRDAAVIASPAGPASLTGQGGTQPGVSVLKPLHGAEPLLEAALASTCAQDFPTFQVVFGVSRADDPALAVVERLRRRFSAVDIAVVVDSRRHGTNPKVGNLINMLPAAKHDVLVIADSDLHVAPDWLTRVVAALDVPGTGLACTLYAGLPATGVLVERLAAMHITHTFLPGALLSRALGRQDCLGATMALRRETLARLGGLAALADHLADDNMLGRRVRALGLDVALADTVPATTVPEATLAALWRHELRWARTIRALVPGQFAASVLQYPIAWSLLALALSGGALWSWSLFETAWVTRALAAKAIDRALRRLGAQEERGSAPDPAKGLCPLDPRQGRSPWNPLVWFGDGGMAGAASGVPAIAGAPLAAPAIPPSPNQVDWIPKAPPLPGIQGAEPLGGVRGGAPPSSRPKPPPPGVAFRAPLWLLPVRELLSVGVMLASYAGLRVDWRGEILQADGGEVNKVPPP
jgi:ceramide glucosyltransferase